MSEYPKVTRFFACTPDEGDGETIKALEHCSKGECDGCPISSVGCTDRLAANALDIINRQKEEIEQLEVCNDKLKRFFTVNFNRNDLEEIVSRQIRELKAEVAVEFAKKLKQKACNLTEFDEGGWSDTVSAVKVDDIDRLIEEIGCNDG